MSVWTGQEKVSLPMAEGLELSDFFVHFNLDHSVILRIDSSLVVGNSRKEKNWGKLQLGWWRQA